MEDEFEHNIPQADFSFQFSAQREYLKIEKKIFNCLVEISKKKNDANSETKKQYLETEARQKFAQKVITDTAAIQKQRIKMEADNIIKDLQTNKEND